jgi:nitronate monooxygenase
LRRDLRASLGCTLPLMLAGMGGVAGPALVAAVSEAGAAGTLGLYKLDPRAIGAALADVEARTAGSRKSYGVNFVPEVMSEHLLAERLEAALASGGRCRFVSFFGLPPLAVATRVREARRTLVVMVGTEADAEEATALGAEVLVLQGEEAGGHLLGTSSTEVLVRRVRARQPEACIVAAGGIGGGADWMALERAGADGCMLGTVFVAAAESSAHSTYKEKVVGARASDTTITDLFEIGWPGRRHRVVRNSTVAAGASAPASFIAKSRVGGTVYPIPRFSAAVPLATTEGDHEAMALYCGTSCEAVSAVVPAAAILARLQAEYRVAVATRTPA